MMNIRCSKITNIIALFMVCILLNFHYKWGYLCFIALGILLFLIGTCFNGVKVWPLCKLSDIRGQYVFLALYFMSAILSKDIYNVGNVIDFIYLGIPLPLLMILDKRCSIRKGIFYGICTSIGIGILYSFYNIFIIGVWNRPSGFMYNPIPWISFLTLSLPLILYKIHLTRGNEFFQEKLMWLLVILILSNLYIARTRAIFIAIVVSIPFLLMVYNFRWYHIVIFLGACGIAWFAQDFIIAKISRGYDMDRWNAYLSSWDMFAKHPFLGVGAANWRDIYLSNYWPYFGGEKLIHAHNLYLSFLAKSGVMGFGGLVFCFLYYCTKLYKEIINHNLYAWCGLFGILIFIFHGLFDSLLDLRSSTRVFWLFIAIYNINLFEDNKAEVK